MKKGYILLFVMLLLPISVHALTGSVSINCGSNTVKKGDTVSCSVTATSDEEVTGVSAKVVINGSASVQNFTRDTSLWDDTQGSLKNDGVTFFTITSGGGYSGNFNVGTLTLKIADDAAPGSVNVSLTSLGFVDSLDEDITTGITANSVALTIEESSSGDSVPPASSEPSNNPTTVKPSEEQRKLKEDSKLYLTELQVEGYDLGFDKDILDYVLEIGDEDYLNITPVLNDDTIGSFVVDGNSELVDGSVISIILTPNDEGEEVRYTITISKTTPDDVITTGDNKDNKMTTIIFASIIGLLAIINIVRILLNKKKKDVEV